MSGIKILFFLVVPILASCLNLDEDKKVFSEVKVYGRYEDYILKRNGFITVLDVCKELESRHNLSVEKSFFITIYNPIGDKIKETGFFIRIDEGRCVAEIDMNKIIPDGSTLAVSQ